MPNPFFFGGHITDPDQFVGRKYESEAVERILLASGHQPYLIQATCRDLVNNPNDEPHATT